MATTTTTLMKTKNKPDDAPANIYISSGGCLNFVFFIVFCLTFYKMEGLLIKSAQKTKLVKRGEAN